MHLDLLLSLKIGYIELQQQIKYLSNMSQEGYCVKCKAKREIQGANEIIMKNGRKALKGTCPVCSTGMFKILGKA